ncbi:EexN family lipoprotein [Bartonella raoultii]|uniref:EexN family lipoprotein n=1 Tax=Bartonella raoultii TaxID=1457020 RepID=A0ABS7I3F4_9HYPH|nr:EexN family lipoprotein [Bartonella raoultii]MBX4335208.1 EexN family lipoprotein [Bartonella raoultii]
MHKIIITTLLLCSGGVLVGCEKTHSVEEFKKDQTLFKKWAKKCEKMGPVALEKSKNCQNIVQADMELFQEHYKNLAKKLRENIKKDNETKTQQDNH